MLNTLINLGVTGEEEGFSQRKVTQIINVMSVIGFFLMLIPICFNFFQGEYSNALILTGFNILNTSNLYWNFKRKFVVAKIIVALSILLVPFVNLIFTGRIPAGQYIAHPYSITASLLFTVICFDVRTERGLLTLSVMLHVVTGLTFDSISYYFSHPKPDIDYLLTYYPNYKLGHFVLNIIVVASVLYFKKILQKYQDANEHLLEEFRTKNEEFVELNKYLEQRVLERTQTVEAQKQRITELAFLTSHKVRGPLSSILGITHLMQIDPNDPQVRSFLPKLHKHSLEMDKVITDMNEALDSDLID